MGVGTGQRGLGVPVKPSSPPSGGWDWPMRRLSETQPWWDPEGTLGPGLTFPQGHHSQLIPGSWDTA